MSADTDIGGDAQGPVLSGTFSGPVTMESAPRTPAEFAKAAWLLMVSDQADRRERQQVFDATVENITDRMEHIEARVAGLSGWVIVSGIGTAALALGFGWLMWMAGS